MISKTPMMSHVVIMRPIIRGLERSGGGVLLGVLPYIVAIVLVGSFVRLGMWQLDRAEEKQAIFASYDKAANQPPIAVADGDTLANQARYTPVSVRAEAIDSPLIILENRVVDQTPGIHLLQAARMDDGSLVLLNHGWLEKRAHSTQLDIPVLQSGDQTYKGLVDRLPATGFKLGELPQRHPESLRYSVPRIEGWWLQQIFGTEIERVVLLTEQQSPWRRQWRPGLMPTERHKGYALQWFSLASAVLLISIFMAWRAMRRRSKK